MAIFFTFTSNHDKKHRKAQNMVNRFVSVNNGKTMRLRLSDLHSLMGNLKILLEGHFPTMYHLEYVKSECCVQVRFLLPADSYEYETIISISDVCK
jgi:Ni,Fe-hydrogenase III component G